MLPTGGYLFNEVGYFDQVLYLLLFAAIWLVRRGRLVAATCVMCVAPGVHEIAILTVIPVFGVVALRTLPVARAFAVTLVPAVINAVLLVIPGASADATAQLSAALAHANFGYRRDVLDVFARTPAANWELYNVSGAITFLRPFAIVLVVAFIALWLTDRRLWQPRAPLRAAAGIARRAIARCAPPSWWRRARRSRSRCCSLTPAGTAIAGHSS